MSPDTELIAFKIIKMSIFGLFYTITSYSRFHYTATLSLKSLRPILVLVDCSQIKSLVIKVLNDKIFVFYEANGQFYII